jgi:hypothetical protein
MDTEQTYFSQHSQTVHKSQVEDHDVTITETSREPRREARVGIGNVHNDQEHRGVALLVTSRTTATMGGAA